MTSMHSEQYELPDSADCVDAVSTYLDHDKNKGHRLTVRECDQRAGTWASVSAETIRSTRRPYLNSRISDVQRDWFVDRAASAPFAEIGLNENLAHADPLVEGGLYARALSLYDHFAEQAPRGVSTAKIHKVLYCMRPRLFPILDSRLLRLLKPNARAAGYALFQATGNYDLGRLNYWEAVRKLLCDNEETLADTRETLMDAHDPFIRDAANFLTDLRLLDMVLWQAE